MKKLPFTPGLLLLAIVLFGGCSSDQSGGSEMKTATQPAERLDPYSVPLYPAKKQVPATDFTATLLNGSNFQLSNQHGKVVIMNIWATWCAPCREETPEFVDLYGRYKDQGLVILGVSIDKQGKSVVQPFMEKYNVNYPMIIDDGTIMGKYGPTMGIPTSYIIDKEGNLRYFAVGALTQKELEPRIKNMLSE